MNAKREKNHRAELVPTEAELARAEGRDYEPASVLLERIQNERQDGQPARRQRKTTARARGQALEPRGAALASRRRA